MEKLIYFQEREAYMIQDFPVVVVHANVDRTLYEKAALGEAVLFYSSKPVGALRDVPKEEFKAQAEYYVPSSRALDLYNVIKDGAAPDNIIGGLQLKIEEPERMVFNAIEKLKWKSWREEQEKLREHREEWESRERSREERFRMQEEAQPHYSRSGSRYRSSSGERELRAMREIGWTIERLGLGLWAPREDRYPAEIFQRSFMVFDK